MNQYSLQNKLGEGAFSAVYKAKRKQDGQDYAMKKMKIMGFSERELSNCLNQVRILASIQDSYVLAYKDSFFDELTRTFCIVTEYMDGGDLHSIISKHRSTKKPIQQHFIWKVAYHVLKGLSALHKQNILHRDIKSANIFMTKDLKHIKLGDMNVSIVSANGMAKTQTGTPYYASPQVWNEKPYSAKCDIWSLGCVLHEMATFKPPFVGTDMKNLKSMVVSGVYKRISSQYSNQLQQFIRACLKVDPSSRPTAQQLLKYPQFQKLNQPLTINKTQFKLLDKINVPKKRDFRIIKDRLPKNRFSVSKIPSNCIQMIQKNKQNYPNLGCTTNISQTIRDNKMNDTGKIVNKNNLPSIQRSVSASVKSANCQQKKQKISNNQVQIIQPQDKPLIPKNRPPRA